jgi:hypothetical protein
MMETRIRGIIEEEIDYVTQPERLGQAVEAFQETFPIGDTEDFAFGFIVGEVLRAFTSIIQLLHRRFPTVAETDKCIRILENNTMKIKGNIKLALGK